MREGRERDREGRGGEGRRGVVLCRSYLPLIKSKSLTDVGRVCVSEKKTFPGPNQKSLGNGNVQKNFMLGF